ncbi:MAG: chemotaxis protein methyltransferase CheR [Bacteroidota bacterium]|nr:chemotaxis protein methyltransferase CheR [Bacteroidota bacterium]
MIDFDQLEEIILLIDKIYGFDFSGYSRASLLRRFNRFMEVSQMKSVVDLKFELLNNPEGFTMLINEIVVNVSEFFRDPEFFKSLVTNVFPYLASYPKINIWSAGCSHGEEIYSLNIFLKELELKEKSRLYATDISSKALTAAKKGIYLTKDFKNYATNYFMSEGKESLNQYFIFNENKAIINADFKNNILFANHNLVTDGVFKEFQLIVCRNVLIYFDQDLQNKALNLFYNSLPIHGFLALGNKESLRFSNVYDNFKEIDAIEKIYQKIK